MAEKKQASAAAKDLIPTSSLPPQGILIDLETLVQDHRKQAWTRLAKRLKKAGEKNGLQAFVRVGLSGTPQSSAAAVARECGLEAEAAATMAAEGVVDLLAAYEKGEGKAVAGVPVLAKSSARVVAVTWMPESTAQSLVSSLGLEALGIQLVCVESAASSFPDADTWIKAARLGEGSVRSFVAVVDNNAACQSALSAGFRCLVVPDEYTSFQDFGGADGVLEGLSGLPAAFAGLIG